MKTKILLFVLCISFITITYQCQCPSYRAPPKEIPKNIDSPYDNVVGYNGLIYNKGTVKATQGTKNVAANCQKDSRLPTQAEYQALLNFIGNNHSKLISDLKLEEGKYYVSSTKTNPGVIQGEGAYDFYSISVSNNKVVLSSINTYQNRNILYAKCVVSASSFDIELPNRGIVKNEWNQYKLVTSYATGIMWNINYSLYYTPTIGKTFKDVGCYLIEAWQKDIAGTTLYKCKQISVGNVSYFNKNTQLYLDQFTIIETGVKVNTENILFFQPSNGPLAPKPNGGFYVFYTTRSGQMLNVLDYDDKYKYIKTIELKTKGRPLDIAATEWGFGVLYSNKDNALYFDGYYSDGQLRFSRVIYDNNLMQKDQIIFTSNTGSFHFGLENMWEAENGKVTYGNGLFGVSFAHYNDFNYGNGNRNGHTGDTFILFDQNGDNEKIAWNWEASHSLIQSMIFTGKYFVYTTLGDAYPENFNGCIIDPSSLQSVVDGIHKRQDRVWASCQEMHPQHIPGDHVGNACGRMGSIHFNGEKYAMTYTIKPCGTSSGKTELNEVGLITFTLDGRTIKNKTKVVIPGLSAKKIINIRSGKYGKYILITYTTRENIGEYNEPPYWGINLAGETFLILVDFDGQIIKGPVRSSEYLMNLSDDLRELPNGSLIWTTALNDGSLKIIYLPKLI